MRVRFARTLLDDSQAWRELDRIVDSFWQDRHIWVIDDPAEIEESGWIQTDSGRAGRQNRETLAKFSVLTLYPALPRRLHSILIVVTAEGTSEYELSPERARRCLEAPAYVLVENATSDGAFLLAMVSVFNRKELRDAFSNGWWRPEHLGGFGEVEKRIDDIRTRAEGPLRVFVLTDSDRLYPGHITNTVQKIEATCAARRVPYAVLRKRRIENYLPQSILHALKGRRRVYRAFAALTEDQRDHYDMKAGFRRSANGQAEIPEEQRELYRYVPRHTLDALCEGFGREVWRQFETDLVKISEGEMRSVCGRDPGEIERILDEIEAIL